MPKATFGVELTPATQTDDGADDVTFVLAPNPGESPRPLAKAASGGELSRAMLALRVVRDLARARALRGLAAVIASVAARDDPDDKQPGETSSHNV